MEAEIYSLQTFLEGFCFSFCQTLKRTINRREMLASCPSHLSSAVQNQHDEPFSCCCNMLQKVGYFQYPCLFESTILAWTLTATVCAYVLTLASCWNIKLTLKKYHLVNTTKQCWFVYFVCFQMLIFVCIYSVCLFKMLSNVIVHKLSKVISWIRESQSLHCPQKTCYSVQSGEDTRPNSHIN